ncbi:hypothetical protein SKDZ_14G2320 [Saccharomyces kudriavzevii ZP591]|nr:hypothetical protein SKDZ_14G2320 [Saccharomyces kudriavzevii ZP591]
MPPNSKNKRRKNKSKQHTKKNGNLDPEQHINPAHLVSRMEPELYHTESEYPTSRVIKRAPNGDVIVEPINMDDDKNERATDLSENKDSKDSTSLAFTLDSHWESLSPEEKKTILRIEKEEVFNVIRNYQDDHSCSCSVCGRRHLAMDQEMERIYNTLYAMDKDKDPETNPVKFHLGIIKELQISKNQQQNDLHSAKGEVVKTFLSSSTVDSLKEEVLHFKQKQLSKQEPVHEETADSTSFLEENLNNVHINKTASTISTNLDSVNDEELKQKYSNFTKTFISSHPKIAQEYVQKMMMYPNIRALTDDLMSNNGQGFLNAIEDFVQDDQLLTPKKDDSATDDKSSYADLTDPKEFTTMLHSGEPLTEDEYADLQRNIAERMTNAYDTTSKQFKDVSQLEKELFTRFMSGNDKKYFRELIIQSFRNKFDGELGPSVLAATLSSCFSSQTKDNSIDTDSIYEDEEEEDYDYSEYAEDSEEVSEYEEVEEEKRFSHYDDKNNEVRDTLHLSDDHEHKGQNHSYHHYHNVSTHSEDEGSEEEYISDVDLPRDSLQHYRDDDGILDEDEDDLEGRDENEEQDEEDEEEDAYDSGLDESDRLEEGRKLIQIAITKLLQSRIMASYHEKQADNNRLKLLQELEEEKRKKREKEEKKQKKREKEKEKKKLQQLAKEEEKRKREEEKERLKKELEEREMKRREAQRKKVEEAKRKKDEERKRRLEEQQRREEMQEKQRKQREEQKRKREEEKKRIREQKRLQQEKLQREKEEEEKKRIVTEDKLRKQKLSEEQISANVYSSNFFAENGVSNSASSQLLPSINRYQEESNRSINDEILKMVNGVAASKPVSPTGFNIHDLLLSSNDNQMAAIEQPQLSQPANKNNAFGSATIPNAVNFSTNSSSLAENDYLMRSQTQQNGSMLMPNGSSSTKLLPNDFVLSSWGGSTNTLSTNSACKPPNIQATGLSPQVQRLSPQPTIPTFGLSEDGTHRKSFAEELNTLTSMLSSAGFADTSLSSGFPQSQRSVWNDQKSSFSGPTTAGNFNNNSVQSGMILPSTMTNAEMLPHRTSIWDNSSTPMASKPDVAGHNMSSTAQDSPVFMPSNIWSNNNTYSEPYLAGNTKPPSGIPHGMDESHILDSIYNTYLTISLPDSLNQYVAVGTLFQSLMGFNMDYSTFIHKLISMQAVYNCEFFTDPNGTITHVRFARQSPTSHSKGLLSKLFNDMNDPTTTPFTSRPHTSTTATFPITPSTTQTS